MATYKRRIIREKVLQALYAYEISKEPIAGVINNILGDLKNSKDDFEFARRLVTEVIRHEETVEKMIREKVAHWEYDRIALIDKILLRMGICELLYFSDIPPKVTLNETIEVGKAFSTEQSGKFINGVLDAVLEDLKLKDQMHKSGRGLIDENIHPEARPSQPGRKHTTDR